MDNKLSELSKPVAWRYRYTKPGITDSNGEAWVGDWKFVTDEVNCNPAPNYQKCALYSQEYVSALLARVEELQSELSEWTECKHTGYTWHDRSGCERCGKCGADIV
ncbi:hypothetical protein [Serratia marcescens]|uniref:hypothetical protein n=1 Tax=Serratia marcescens TaxID=615 RepID=UPI0006ED30F1|nr:hypothetical protein [Serratia marcescens]ALL39040.1 hypothetical protein AR325_19435 [Serratia marcescens]UJA52764.1 hypothetical protein L1F17_17435 [Serratia marcescens]UJA52820.1 hypothetical protein L1F17_17745 [Serratia marcescens]